MNKHQEFSARMKRFRLDRLWTLRQMATACGLDVRTVWNIENGKVKPQELTIEKIRRALPGLFETETSEPKPAA